MDKSEAVSGSGPVRCPAAMALLAGRRLAVWMALRRHRQPCQNANRIRLPIVGITPRSLHWENRGRRIGGLGRIETRVCATGNMD
jgi:hypothetical protein